MRYLWEVLLAVSVVSVALLTRLRRKREKQKAVKQIKQNEEQYATVVNRAQDVMLRELTERNLRVEQMAQLEKAKTEFVSIAAHQLRATVSAIMTTSHIMHDYDADNLTSSQKGLIDKVIKEASQMNELADFLLRISKAEGGIMSLAPLPVQLERLTKDIIGMLDDTIKKKHLKVSVLKEPEVLPIVSVDQNALTQVIRNLLANAVEYSAEGGEIVISIAIGNRSVRLSVQDDGIGISRADQKRIFDKFYRSEQAKALSSSGAGLGLALAKAIVEMLGGKIWVRSALNKGSTFYISFPTAREAPAKPGPAKRKPVSKTSKKA